MLYKSLIIICLIFAGSIASFAKVTFKKSKRKVASNSLYLDAGSTLFQSFVKCGNQESLEPTALVNCTKNHFLSDTTQIYLNRYASWLMLNHTITYPTDCDEGQAKRAQDIPGASEIFLCFQVHDLGDSSLVKNAVIFFKKENSVLKIKQINI